MTDKPNILFLSVDAFRFDRTSLHGYERPTTPFLKELAETATVCTQTTSTAAFTQPSLPSMLTSTLPLSYGGYDNGAIKRPDSIFKVMKTAGYETSLLSTFPWVNRFFGYGDGIDNEHFLFVLNSLVGISCQRMRSTLHAYYGNILQIDDLIDQITPTIEGLFNDIETYCDVRTSQVELNARDMQGERLLRDNYNFAAVKNVANKHRIAFRQDRKKYIITYFHKVPMAHEWIAKDWRFKRRIDALVLFGFQRLFSAFAKLLNHNYNRVAEYRSKRYIDGHALTNRILNTIDDRDSSRPFFIWTHFLDTHVPYCPGAGTAWASKINDYLSPLGYPAKIDPAVAVSGAPKTDDDWAAWGALYDAAVRYVDQQICRLYTGLKLRGLTDKTLIVLTGDHGEELGEHGDISHHFRMYEHNIRVPMLFAGPGIKSQQIHGLTTTMDLAPTIADLVGVDRPTAWQGASVTSPKVSERSHVLAEAFHSGNCLFDSRPPYIAVRTKQHKFLWKEHRDTTDRFSPEGLELFDIKNDPDELSNLYRPDHPALPKLERYVAERLAAIPEISSDRIIKSFGAIGKDAIDALRPSTTPKESKAE